MDGTTTTNANGDHAHFETGRLFLADSRLAYVVLNHVRRRAIARVFGVSDEQANVLTFVIAASAAEAAYATARRLVRTPSRDDAVLAGLLLREGALGIAGPKTRQVPLAGAILTLALVGGSALPALRSAVKTARAAERRIRLSRISRYRAVAGR
jgi:hypothetical protein